MSSNHNLSTRVFLLFQERWPHAPHCAPARLQIMAEKLTLEIPVWFADMRANKRYTSCCVHVLHTSVSAQGICIMLVSISSVPLIIGFGGPTSFSCPEGHHEGPLEYGAHVRPLCQLLLTSNSWHKGYNLLMHQCINRLCPFKTLQKSVHKLASWRFL